MSLASIRDEYRVPARIGARVSCYVPGDPVYTGVITGSQEDELIVNFEGLPVPQFVRPDMLTFHPTTKEN